MADIIHIDDEIKRRLLSKFPQSDDKITIAVTALSYDVIKTSDYVIDENNIVTLPETINQEVYGNKNCSQQQRGWVENASVSTTKGNNVTINRGVTSSKNLTINANINASFGGIGASGGISSQQSIQISNSFQNSFQAQVTESRQRSIDTTVKPMTILLVKLRNTTSNLRLPFKLTIQIDGEYTVKTTPKFFEILPGIRITDPAILEGHATTVTRKISETLSEDERIFLIEGFLDNARSTSIDVTYSERSLTDEDCTDVSININNNDVNNLLDVISSNQNLTEDNINTFINLKKEFFLPTSAKISKETLEDLEFTLVIEEYFGSITITTANVVGNVEVQHFSFGPGFCNVITRTPSEAVTINAPPFMWSGWQLLFNHLGEVTTTITNQVNCDTGVRSQVKYFKKI